jgi:Glycosyltransferase family 87
MRPWLRQSLVVMSLGVCLIAIFRLSPRLMNEMATFDDFVQYWVVGRLNINGANPYNPARLIPLQLQFAREHRVPMPEHTAAVMTWSPPWTLALVMPFGAIDYPFSRLLWLISQTALVLFCASYTWQFYRGPTNLLWVAWLIAITFLPTLLLFKTGQISEVILLGAVLFLMFTQHRVWWLASLAVLFISIKPNTLYLVLLAFIFWAISERRWSLLPGSALGICLATGIALLFNPAVLKQYFYALSHHPPSQWATPTIGSLLRFFLGKDKVWLQFVPTALGMVWFCYYWLKKRHTWNWPKQLPLLMLVSLLTASYDWPFDYVLLIPVILLVATGLFQQHITKLQRFLAIGLYLSIEAGALATNLYSQNYFYFIWFVPALAGWYFLMVRWGAVGLHSELMIESR